MSKRDEFIAEVKGVKSTFSNITDDQHRDLIRKGVKDYDLTRDEAEKILKAHGPKVGQAQSVNYFEVLELKNEDIENLRENEMKKTVQDAYNKIFKEYRDRPDQHNPSVKKKLGELKVVSGMLENPNELIKHFHEIIEKNDDDDDDDDHNKQDPQRQSARTIIKFRNGDQATSILQLATLMEKNAKEATDMLYGGYLEKALEEAKEFSFALMVPQVINAFRGGNPSMGLMAMVSLLRGKVKMGRGGEASTPRELARLIDQNWNQAKTLLYNGFFELWLEYYTKTKLANIADKIKTDSPNDEDIGLEEFVQSLDPSIGHPELEVSQSKIDFGRMDTRSKKTIQFKINKKMGGRGFLYGDVQLVQRMPGLRISDTEIKGNGIVTVELDASALTAKQTHKGWLAVETNGGELNIPISCYIDYPSQKSIPEVPKIEKKSQIRNTGRSIGWWLATGLLTILFSTIGGFIAGIVVGPIGAVIIFLLGLFRILPDNTINEDSVLSFIVIAGMVIGFISTLLVRLGGRD